MRTGCVLWVAGASLLFFQQVCGRTVVDIQKALDKKYINAKALCSGGLQLDYSVSNLLSDSLYVTIPAGWRFNSDAGKSDYQDILMTRREVLAMKPKETKRFNIRGFCCEASKSGPKAGVPYTSGKMADSSLVLLARYLNSNPIDQNTQQYAVWAISDQKETANITHKNDSLAGMLRAFVSGLKGEPLPWYTLLKKAVVTAYGDVNDYPVRFKANIPYAVARECYSYCYIVDDKGNTVSEIFGKWLLPQGSDYSASFNVANLKKGEYRLILESKEAALFEKSFRI